MLRVVAGSQQAELFACKANEHDRVARTLGRMRQKVSQFQDPADAGGIVVSAVMRLTLLIRRERIPVSQAEMIVMSADHDILVCEFRVRPRQFRDDIRYLSMDALDVYGQR